MAEARIVALISPPTVIAGRQAMLSTKSITGTKKIVVFLHHCCGLSKLLTILGKYPMTFVWTLVKLR